MIWKTERFWSFLITNLKEWSFPIFAIFLIYFCGVKIESKNGISSNNYRNTLADGKGRGIVGIDGREDGSSAVCQGGYCTWLFRLQEWGFPYIGIALPFRLRRRVRGVWLAFLNRSFSTTVFTVFSFQNPLPQKSPFPKIRKINPPCTVLWYSGGIFLSHNHKNNTSNYG